MLPPLLVLTLYLIVPLFLFLFILNHNNKTLKKKPLPSLPGPKGLPIIGNLHQLDNYPILHKQLSQLSKKYGPIFSLKLGFRHAIVISSSKLAKEALKNHDTVFSGRPKLLGQQKLSYNGLDIGFSQYGDHWREVRKIGVTHVLSARRVSSFSSIRKFGVKKMIEKISTQYAPSSKVVNLSEMLVSLTSTIICRSAFGRSYNDNEGVERSRFHSLFNELQVMMATFNFVSDYIPFLGWIDRLNGMHKRLERSFKEMDSFYQEVIEEHMDPNRKRLVEKGEVDMIDVLLQLKETSSFSIDITYDLIKALFMDMLVAATDTTAATTVWAMFSLMQNPRVLRKVQEEIRSLDIKKDFLEEDDIQKFTYFKAVIKEVLRLYLPAPLLLPRETNEDCIIGGYEIPAKTIVFINAWAIHRDPETWKDPEEFYPERFFENDIDFRGQDFELIPFGSGRRICPGLHMAVATLDLILANLLYSFNWELPSGARKEDIDTQTLPGIVLHKKNPLCLVAKNHV